MKRKPLRGLFLGKKKEVNIFLFQTLSDRQYFQYGGRDNILSLDEKKSIRRQSRLNFGRIKLQPLF